MRVVPAVVSVPRAHDGLAALLLPDAAHDVVSADDRTYLFYFARQDSDATFVDPTDGELLAELRHFSSESDAREWMAADIALRAAQTGRVQ